MKLSYKVRYCCDIGNNLPCIVEEKRGIVYPAVIPIAGIRPGTVENLPALLKKK